MGLGTPPTPQGANLAERYPPGAPFLILNVYTVERPDGQPGGIVTVAPPSSSQAAIDYAVGGTLAQQIAQVEPGDVPGIYTLVHDAGRWLFEKVGQPEPGELPPQAESNRVAPPDVHESPDAAVDPPNPAPALDPERPQPRQPGPPPEGEPDPPNPIPPPQRPPGPPPEPGAETW